MIVQRGKVLDVSKQNVLDYLCDTFERSVKRCIVERVPLQIGAQQTPGKARIHGQIDAVLFIWCRVLVFWVLEEERERKRKTKNQSSSG